MNSPEPAADELPKQVVAWVARTLGPGSRIQVVRRLPVGSWHLNHALAVVDRDGLVHHLVCAEPPSASRGSKIFFRPPPHPSTGPFHSRKESRSRKHLAADPWTPPPSRLVSASIG
jgi:hypothetical protein